MSLSVWVNVPVLKPGALGGDLTVAPENLGGDRVTCRVPAVAWKQPLLRLAPEPAPVDAQFLEQLRAEHDIAVLAALALSDVDHHPLAVDVADLQMGRFCAACAGGIKRHQQDAMKGFISGINQPRNLFLTEYPWKATHLLRIRCLGDAPAALQHVDIEEPQRRQPQDHSVRAELQLGEKHCLVLANVFRAKLIGWAPEVSAEVRNTVQVGADGCFGKVATLQLLKHELT